MRKRSLRLLSTVAVAAVLTLAACGGAGPSNGAADTSNGAGESPESVVRRWMEAMKAGDVNAYVACMAVGEQGEARNKFGPLDLRAKADYEVGKAEIVDTRAKVPMKLIATDNSQPSVKLSIHCVKESDGWKITEIPCRAAEGRAMVGMFKDQLRLKYVMNNNELPSDLTVDQLRPPRSKVLPELQEKYYGTYKLNIRGSKNDGYKGTTITAEPSVEGGAPVVTLTLTNIEKGEYTVVPPEE